MPRTDAGVHLLSRTGTTRIGGSETFLGYGYFRVMIRLRETVPPGAHLGTIDDLRECGYGIPARVDRVYAGSLQSC